MSTQPTLKTINIIGTSNSITRVGYGTKLITEYKNQIKVLSNLSYGASHSPLIPYTLDLLGNRRADFCLLDLCVNEHRAHLRGMYNFSETWLALDYFLLKCTKLKMMPIVLLIPSLDRYGKIDVHTTDRWKNVCKKQSVPFIDIHAYLKQINPERPEDLYMDASHIGELASDLLAKTIIKLCDELMVLDDFKYTYKSVYDYQIVRDFHDQPKSIKNRLFSSTFWPLLLNEPVSCTLQPKSILVGLSINAAQSNSFLKISTSDNVFYKRLDSILTNPDKEMWHLVWQLIEPISSESSSLELEVVADCDGVWESNDHHSKEVPDKDYLSAGNARIEINALIFRSASSDRKRVFKYNLDPDLLRLVNS
jgi:hypothetical protein